ncbi:hypothetical protein GCM10023066_12350 [Nocardioides kongjuensis]
MKAGVLGTWPPRLGAPSSRKAARPQIARLMTCLAGLAAVAAVLAGLAGCSGSPEPVSRVGVFTFSPPGGPAVPVWYLIHGSPADAQIVLVLTGTDRNAEDYRSDWEDLTPTPDLLVLVPEFSKEDFPSEQYNLGGLENPSGADPQHSLTFGTLNQIVERGKVRTGATDTRYSVFGHSAGAQFAARLVEFAPSNALEAVVAANPGWYTMPDDDQPFPYGLSGIDLDENDLGAAFATNFTLMLGADDIDEEDPNLRHDDGSDSQGDNRLERGLAYFGVARRTAAKYRDPFAWGLVVVPEVSHDHHAMAAAAAPYLFPDSSPTSGRPSAVRAR